MTMARSLMLLLILTLGVGMACPAWAQAKPTPSQAERIPPLEFQGEPMFLLSTFGGPKPKNEQAWRAAGGNAILTHKADSSIPREKMQSRLREFFQRCERLGAAAIIYTRGDFWPRNPPEEGVSLIDASKHPDKWRDEAVAYLRDILAVAADSQQILGYYTFDEPENHFNEQYKKQQETGLGDAYGQWLLQRIRWVSDTLRQGDPDAYMMPLIGWWTQYKNLSPLADVPMVNEYPAHPGDEPLTGPLYNVVYDAAKAAEAVRQTEMRSFIYMPQIFDKSPDPDHWRTPTLAEVRYFYFAPLTQGAMGIIGWRGGRCSDQYLYQVVYPVMRQVDQLKPYLLGQWCDGQVTCNRHTASVDYLKEFPRLIRNVPGEQAGEMEQVQGLPDVSHMMRRISKGRYLLLAVNNRKEPTPVTFTLRGIENLPDQTRDALTYRPTPIEDGKIQTTMEPFGVRAYLFQTDENGSE